MSFPFFDFSSSPPYQQIFDYNGTTNGTPLYAGWATPGVAQSDPKWKIRQFIYDTNNQILTIKHANADVGFKFQWSQRATYTYS